MPSASTDQTCICIPGLRILGGTSGRGQGGSRGGQKKRREGPEAAVLAGDGCHARILLQDYYYLSVKALYTAGYSTSLVTLTTAMVILCRFR